MQEEKFQTTILGNLKIICWFKGVELVKITTGCGTNLDLSGVSDCEGYLKDIIRNRYVEARSKGRSVCDS